MAHTVQERLDSNRQVMKKLQKRYRNKIGKSEVEDVKLRAKLELLKDLLKQGK